MAYMNNQQDMAGIFKKVKRGIKKVAKVHKKILKPVVKAHKAPLKLLKKPAKKSPVLVKTPGPVAIPRPMLPDAPPPAPAVLPKEIPGTSPEVPFIPVVSPPPVPYSPPGQDWSAIDFSYQPLDFSPIDNINLPANTDWESQSEPESVIPDDYEYEAEPVTYDEQALEGLFSGLKKKLKKVVQKAGASVATVYGGPAAGAAVKGLLDSNKNKQVQTAIVKRAGDYAVAEGLPRSAGENEARKQIGLSTAAKIGIGAAVAVPVLGLLAFAMTRKR